MLINREARFSGYGSQLYLHTAEGLKQPTMQNLSPFRLPLSPVCSLAIFFIGKQQKIRTFRPSQNPFRCMLFNYFKYILL